ncbi:hydroxyacylglutathione hydrolase [Marinobacter daqiaonensis]|uniref:Hydroxyacylglutathione hydrolase n=1 Tax=Marinobacter daqiaonensis TaxID=650891 RepID=A0A1I6GV70_9GAMM|nr:hydroxyacylglutathione hydrolase [Marinobacter daqiaonensis]SFR46135.1 hydroxyacylglutathione hydrolase [Marinobacter daqiaonensis]
MLNITPLRAFSDNYIWCLANTDSGKALVVDPGEAEPVLRFLEQKGLTLDTILITHHHPDHTGGVARLREQLQPKRVVGPADSPFTDTTDTVHAGDEVVWESLTFDVLATPGHTLDHIAYYADTRVEGQRVLFCGDTLFACGCGRLFEGTAGQMVESLGGLRTLPDDTAVYCAHEYTLANLRFARSWLPDDPALKAFEDYCRERREMDQPTVPVTLGDEKIRNPFLRWDDPVVIEAADRYGRQEGLKTDSDTGVFAAVRHGKDHF